MNIGIDITPLTSSVRTGVGEYTYELLDALFRIDQTNQYFLFYNAWKDVSKCIPKWEQANVHVIHTRWPNKLFHISVQIFSWPKMDTLIGKKAHVSLDYFFSPNLGFQSISKACKHILTIHDLSFEIFPECFSLKMRLWHWFLSPKRQCTSADKIMVPSKNTKRDIVDVYGIKESKIHVTSFGLASTFFVPVLETAHFQDLEKKYNLPEKYILFFGTIEPRKNITALLQAFQKSDFFSKGYELVVVGAKGWKNKTLVQALEQTQGVRYIGYIEPEEKPFFYRGASIFVYPSLYEGFGFPVLEAFGCGVPVITSNRSSLPEVAGDAAYYVNPYNISELVLALQRFDEEKELRELFIQKGFEQVKKFQWNKTAEQFLSLLS